MLSSTLRLKTYLTNVESKVYQSKPTRSVPKTKFHQSISISSSAHTLKINPIKIVPSSIILSFKSRHVIQIKRSCHSRQNRFYSSSPNESGETPPQASTELEYRSSLKAFLMRVHPDFFSKYPKIQEENDRSLKQLNSVLDIVEDYNKKPSGLIQLDPNRVPPRISTIFYLRPNPKTLAQAKQDELNKNKEKSDSPEQKMPLKPEQEFEIAKATYVFPQRYFESGFPRERLEADIRRFLNELLKQAKLPTMAVPSDPTNEAAEEQFGEDGEYKPRKYGNSYAEAKATRKEFKEILAAFLDKHYPRAQIAIDKLGHTWEQDIGIKEEANIAMGIVKLHQASDRERQQIHYSPDLDGEERTTGLMLVTELWATGQIPQDIPIFITKGMNAFIQPEALPGFISIPIEFDNETLHQYLKENLKTIMITRYNIRSQLLDCEYMIKQFKQSFKLAFIDVHTSLENSHVCLSAINSNKEQIEKWHPYLEGMKWHIVDSQSASRMAMQKDFKPYPTNTNSDQYPEYDNNDEAISNIKKETDLEEETSNEVEFNHDEDVLSDMRRSKANISDDVLKRNQSIRAEKFKKEVVDDPFADEELEMEDKEAEFTDEQIEQPEEPEDEFIREMKAQMNQNKQLVYTDGTPSYSLKTDILSIPFNTSGDSLVAWLESNEAILHWRKKMYPSQEWKLKVKLICRNLRLLLAVEKVGFRGAAIWNKHMQLRGLTALQTHSEMLKKSNLKGFSIVITSGTYSVNLKRKILYLPYSFTPATWAQFRRNMQQELLRRRQARQAL